jgi:hypothetical protein
VQVGQAHLDRAGVIAVHLAQVAPFLDPEAERFDVADRFFDGFVAGVAGRCARATWSPWRRRGGLIRGVMEWKGGRRRAGVGAADAATGSRTAAATSELKLRLLILVLLDIGALEKKDGPCVAGLRLLDNGPSVHGNQKNL